MTSLGTRPHESSMFPGFTVRIDRDHANPTIADVHLRGDLDAANVDHLADAVNALIEQGSTHLRLAMANVGFIDAAGFRGLIAADDLVRRHNGHLIITSISAPVGRLVTLLGPDLLQRMHEYPARA